MKRRSSQGVRARTHAFIQRNLRAWELVLALVALVSVIVGVRSTELGEPEDLATAEWALTGIFAAEYSLRVWAAPSRLAYIKSALIDLVSILPPVRGVRLLRLIRFMRVAENLGAALETTSMGRRAVSLARVAILWISVVAIAAIGLYNAELGSNASIQSGFDALWWAIVTTTVGFGDIAPVTAEGRLAAAMLMILGVGFFSFFTATITASLTAEVSERAALESRSPSLAERLEELEKLKRRRTITQGEFRKLRQRVLNEVASTK